MQRYWIGIASREHVLQGVKHGFAQLNHGKRAPLHSFQLGDWILYYSPRLRHPDGEPLQAFTALGRAKGDAVYQADMGGGFRPYRINVDYLPIEEVPIRPLLEALDFIRDKRHWGAAFRFGLLHIHRNDFDRIVSAVRLDPAALQTVYPESDAD